MDRLLRYNEPYDTEFKIRRISDGAIRDILSKAEVETDISGKMIKVIGVIQDITDRKRADEAIRESQQIIEGIFNTIPVRVFWKDIDLIYQGCNHSFAVDSGFQKS